MILTVNEGERTPPPDSKYTKKSLTEPTEDFKEIKININLRCVAETPYLLSFLDSL